MFQNQSINYRALAAEALGTALLVFIGSGTVISSQALNDFNPSLGNDFLLAVSMAFGLTVTVVAYGIAHISGGHINPAVSLGAWLVGELNNLSFLAYIVAQSLGAFFGSLLLWGAADSSKLMVTATGESYPPFLLGANSVSPYVPLGSAFIGESVGTFLLVLTVLMTAVSKKSVAKNIAPLAIGLSLMLGNLVLVPLTSCGLNPARTFGPQMVSYIGGVPTGFFRGVWVFYTAPFVGAAVAAAVAVYVFEIKKDGEESPKDEASADEEADPGV